jgi:hypothetical protein
MALNRYVLTASVTVAAGTVTGGSFGTASSAGAAGAWAEPWPVTFLAGTAIVLDPAGPLFTTIGSGNLRAWADTEAVGHAAAASVSVRPDVTAGSGSSSRGLLSSVVRAKLALPSA